MEGLEKLSRKLLLHCYFSADPTACSIPCWLFITILAGSQCQKNRVYLPLKFEPRATNAALLLRFQTVDLLKGSFLKCFGKAVHISSGKQPWGKQSTFCLSN